MNPDKSGFSALRIFKPYTDHATQTTEPATGTIIIKDSKSSLKKYNRPPLPRDIDRSKDDTITVYEFCQVLQDTDSPQSVTIIKEKVTEKSSLNPLLTNEDKKSDSWSCRYSYCKEIIKPYLRYPPGCPISDDKIYVDSGLVASEEVLGHQPSGSATHTQDESAQTITSYYESIPKLDVGTSYTSIYTMAEEPKNMVSETSNASEDIKSIKVESIKKQDEKKNNEDNISQTKNEPAKKPLLLGIMSSPSIWSFFKKRTEGDKPSSNTSKSVDNNFGSLQSQKLDETNENENVVIVTKEKEPIALDVPNERDELKELEAQKERELLQGLQKLEELKQLRAQINTAAVEEEDETCDDSFEEDRIVETHLTIAAAVKEAVDEIVERMRNKSRDTLTLLATESVKQFEKLKKTASAINDKKCVEEKCTSSRCKKTNDVEPSSSASEPVKKDECYEPEVKPPVISILDRCPDLDTVVEKVKSSISVIKQGICKSCDCIPDSLKMSNYNDCSSPLDKPSPPKDVAYEYDSPEEPSSVFSIIKSKLCSIFYEDDAKQTESASNPCDDEEKSEIIDRLIE